MPARKLRAGGIHHNRCDVIAGQVLWPVLSGTFIRVFLDYHMYIAIIPLYQIYPSLIYSISGQVFVLPSCYIKYRMGLNEPAVMFDSPKRRASVDISKKTFLKRRLRF